MKIIDLLNKIANGEEVPKRIRIDHWCYKFEWVEHLENYYDKDSDIDLMSALSTNKEELNYEVEIIEEDEEIKNRTDYQYSQIPEYASIKEVIKISNYNFEKHQKAIYKLIDVINNLKGSDN
jgi:hypothetical protein